MVVLRKDEARMWNEGSIGEVVGNGDCLNFSYDQIHRPLTIIQVDRVKESKITRFLRKFSDQDTNLTMSVQEQEVKEVRQAPRIPWKRHE